MAGQGTRTDSPHRAGDWGTLAAFHSHRTVAATEVDGMPVGFGYVMRAGAKGRDVGSAKRSLVGLAVLRRLRLGFGP